MIYNCVAGSEFSIAHCKNILNIISPSILLLLSKLLIVLLSTQGARCSSVVRAFAHGAMGRWIDPSWGGPIELFLVPASAPRLV